MKKLLFTALVGLLALNPFSGVIAPLSPEQCGKIRKLMSERPDRTDWEFIYQNVPGLANPGDRTLEQTIIEECALTEKLLVEQLYMKLNALGSVTEGGNSVAAKVLESHQEVKKAVDDVRTARAIDEISLELIIETAPNALLPIEKCVEIRSNVPFNHDQFYGRESNLRICNNMINLFKKEINNSLAVIENGLAWVNKNAEVEFIKQREKELAMLGVGLEVAIKQRIEAAARS